VADFEAGDAALNLGEIEAVATASANAEGWWLRPYDGCHLAASAVGGEPVNHNFQLVALQASILVDLEVGEWVDEALFLPWNHFSSVADGSAPSLPLRWSQPCPFNLIVNGESEIGRPDFGYRYEFRAGRHAVALERFGYFLRRSATGELFHLDSQTFSVVDGMDRFNASSPEGKAQLGWRAFGEIRAGVEGLGVSLDAYLRSNTVVIPSRIVLSLDPDPASIAPFLPDCDELAPGELGKAFKRNPDVRAMYSIDAADGARTRVLLSDRQKEVLERMKAGAALTGSERAAAYKNPESLFDGLLDIVDVKYGPRVIGVGAFEGRPSPVNPREAAGFFELPGPDPNHQVSQHNLEVPDPSTVLVPSVDGGDVRLEFADGTAREAARLRVEEAIAAGEASVSLGGHTVAVTSETLEALRPQAAEVAPEAGKPSGQFLLVYTNETDTRVQDQRDAEAASVALAQFKPFRLPAAALPGLDLKDHQRKGLQWLESCSTHGPFRRGALLADDMGLGKTRQILLHLAKVLEEQHASLPNAGLPPWRPVLIVAPLILVENETWQQEMAKSFVNSGELFFPLLTLHGAGIDRVRREGEGGNDVAAGRPLLDAAKLMQYRTVITNYETVVRYQHSLAQLHEGRSLWTALITDEAQKYKEPNTKVSHAIKAIPADFSIASTGTPVENRLLDLWNIVDAFQSALLGDEREFSREWERPQQDTIALSPLRGKLLYGQPNAFVMRRTKEELTELPSKTVVRIACEMSAEDVNTHRQLISALSGAKRRGQHLGALQRLSAFYQHPSLLRGEAGNQTHEQLLETSGKLRAVVEELRVIQRRGEKVLIFARFIDMQQILARVIQQEFNTPVSIINGATASAKSAEKSSATTMRAGNARQHVLNRFREASGFGVLVLSPHVAGLGLTIVEANHVIHYGRWWNPAVEAQATDRVYRLGQTRPVKVYLPILRDPSLALPKSFDEKLDELLLRKTALARDFLQPIGDEDGLARELCNELASEDGAPAQATPMGSEEVRRISPGDFEALVAALFVAEGDAVVLTCNVGDGGADVLAVKDRRLTLVQVKHTSAAGVVGESALNDIIGASDLYSERLGISAGNLLLVSNGQVSETVRRLAESQRIEVLSGEQLNSRLSTANVGLAEMVAASSDRAANFEDGLRRVAGLLG